MSAGIPPWRATASATATATTPFTGHGKSQVTTTTTLGEIRMLTNGKAAPAYIPVQARRSLAHTTKPTPTPQPTASEAPRKRVEWPAPLRLYVQRSFIPENQIASVSRPELEVKLKSVITEAAEGDKLDAIDWETLPLPQVMIQNERNRILANPSVSSFSEESSRKRKSTEYTPRDTENFAPPWRQTNHDNKFEDRVTYSPTDKRQRIDHKNNTSKSKINLEMRRKRFEKPRSHYGSSPSSSRGESPAASTHQGPVVGRCQDLEKKYFRLTSAPNPDTVRPLPVLQNTLDLLKKKWKKDNNYGYICDQFKSLRQDLTVQHIRNEFTVNVYEIHARIALEKGDLGEYNQCQTQLRALYTRQLGGHPTEFKAYRVLYFIHTRNWTAMNDALADLSAADKQDPAVKHALDVRSALALGNYHRFFQLYLDTPNMGAYLMDMFVDRERLSALTAISKA